MCVRIARNWLFIDPPCDGRVGASAEYLCKHRSIVTLPEEKNVLEVRMSHTKTLITAAAAALTGSAALAGRPLTEVKFGTNWVAQAEHGG